MKSLKTLLVAVGVMASVASTSAFAQEQRTIRVAHDAAYAPFEYTLPSGEIVGFDVDLIDAMCAKLQAKCTHQNQSWDGIIPSLMAKKYDVIASSMSITDERKRAVNFTQMVWSTPNVLIGKEGTQLEPTKEATAGKELGVQQGTIQDKYATKYFTDANLRRYKTFEDALNDLKTGRIIAVFADAGVSSEFIKSPGGKGYALVGKPVPNSADPEIFGQGTGFAVRKSDTQLLNDLNKAFDQIRADGTYDKLAKKYFTFDVYPKK